MKRTILLLAMLLTGLCYTYAGGPANSTAAKSDKPALAKPLASGDVSLEVERISGEVLMHLYSKTMTKVDMIYVEKSNDPTKGFNSCKAVKVADLLIKSKTYIEVSDATPSAANTDTYYRIRTVTASGETKVYPAIELAPIYEIESLDVADK